MRSLAVALAFLAFSLGCAGPSPAARRAESLLRAGELTAADEAADQGLTSAPADEHLWRVKIRVAATRGDATRAVALWKEWSARRGAPDRTALRQIALLTLWNATHADAPEARAGAVRAAWALDEDRLAEPVAQLLEDDDEVVRATAAAALLRSHPDAPTVLTDSLRSPEARARQIAVEALAEKVGGAAHDDLFAALSDPDPGVRVAALGGVARLGGDEPARLAAVKDPEGIVRAAALRGLAGHPAAVPLAREVVGKDPYLGARLAALEVLDRTLGDRARPELEKLAAGDDTFVALRAAVALARRGGYADGPALLARVAAAKEWTVQVAAAGAAVPVLGERAPAWLTALAAAGGPEVDLAVARALIVAERRDEAIALLTAALALPEPRLRLEALIDLERVGKTAPAAWDGVLADDDAGVRESAAVALRARGPVDALAPLLADTSWKVRVAAAWTVLAR